MRSCPRICSANSLTACIESGTISTLLCWRTRCNLVAPSHTMPNLWRVHDSRQFAEDPLLVGQIAASLLLEESDRSRSHIIPATLIRITDDLTKSRRSLEWLRDARQNASQVRSQPRVITTGQHAHSPNPATRERTRLAPTDNKFETEPVSSPNGERYMVCLFTVARWPGAHPKDAGTSRYPAEPWLLRLRHTRGTARAWTVYA